MSSWGGRSPGAGRKKKAVDTTVAKDTTPLTLEERISQILIKGEKPSDIKRLAHRLAYVEQELEFIKKIILASIEDKPKC